MRLALSEVNRMNIREMVSAIEGFSELKRQEFFTAFEMARYSAFRTAFSKDQARAIKKDVNPYSEVILKSKAPMTMNEVTPVMKSLSHA